MSINLKAPELRELKPRIIVCGVGGAGGNAVNNMIVSGLSGVDFVVANTDAQALTSSRAERIIQMGLQVTEGLGAGSKPEVGRAAAEEALEEIRDHLAGAHMAFVTAGMGGGTGTGAAPVIARVAREMGILTVGVVTKPFHFEGGRRMRLAEGGINELQKSVDTLIVIPNQNLFRVANEKTTFADAFAMADQVLYSGVACITDLMVKEGLINLDFADVRSIMSEMGKAMMGTGEATGERRAVMAAEAAIANPLLDETSMKGARGLLISITGGNDLTLYEVDEAASRIRQEVDEEANIILGATFDSALDGVVRVSVVATGIDQAAIEKIEPVPQAARIDVPSRPRPAAPRHVADADRGGELRRDDAGSPRGDGAGRAERSRSPSGRAQAGGVRGACRAASRRADRAGIHTPGAGTTDDPPAAHAADRGIAARGAKSASRASRRSAAGPPIPSKRGGDRCSRNLPPSASAGTRRRPPLPRLARSRRARRPSRTRRLFTRNTAVRSPARPPRAPRRAIWMRMAALRREPRKWRTTSWKSPRSCDGSRTRESFPVDSPTPAAPPRPLRVGEDRGALSPGLRLRLCYISMKYSFRMV